MQASPFTRFKVWIPGLWVDHDEESGDVVIVKDPDQQQLVYQLQQWPDQHQQRSPSQYYSVL